MKYHYVYRITNIIKRKHYYGIRGSKDPSKDLGIKYFSSSKDKDFLKDQKDNPQDYKYKIIKTYKNRKDAILMEYKLHKIFNVGINESFYNKCKQTLNGFDIGGIKFSKEEKEKLYKHRFKNRRPMSKESREKISDRRKGMKFSDKHKENIKIARAKQKICNNSVMIIFDNNDTIMYKVSLEENFENFCKERKLPFRSLKKSYQRNGEYKLGYKNGMSKSYWEEIKQFDGWYCLKIK